MPKDSKEEEALVGVDRAALIFAAAGSAASLAASDGSWSPMATMFGASFVLLVLAFHRPATGGRLRCWLIRLAFGSALTVSLFLSVGNWVADGSGREFGGGALAIAALTAVVLALLEPAYVRLLAKF